MRRKRRQRRYSFIVLLAVSMIVGSAGWAAGILREEDGRIALHVPMLIGQVYAESEQPEGEEGSPLAGDMTNGKMYLDGEMQLQTGTVQTDPAEGGTSVMDAKGADSDAEDSVKPKDADTEEEASAEGAEAGTDGEESARGKDGAADEEESDEPLQVPVMCTANVSYFDDALFIGDSRTVGLHEYGDLGNAEVVADSGMNVYKIYDKEFSTASGEKKGLEAILQERQFGKIYLMLGINELGYDFDRTVSRYTELVEKLQELQPEAMIFLEANLHITGAKSEDSPVFNNENINRFNHAVEQLADGQRVFYLDVNELFDDEDGNLAEEYTVDHAHVLGKYYTDWVNWILEHAYADFH